MKASHKYILTGSLILLLAAGLRLTAFTEALIGADQSSILSGAANIADGAHFPLIGMKSSIGPFQPAATLYLAALPLLVIRRVVAIKYFFSLLDILSIALLYRTTRRACGPQAAWVAALLYATNPWIVEFNRWIWYQTLIPTFATLACAALLAVLSPKTRARNGWLATAFVSATIMGQVHLVAAIWMPILFLLATLLAMRQRLWRGLGTGLLLSLGVSYPYLRYLLLSRGADVLFLLSGRSGTQTWNWATFRLSFELLGGREVLSTPRDPLWANSVFAPNALYLLIPTLIAIAILGIFYRWIRHQPPSKPQWLLILWTLLAPTVFVFFSFHLQHFYLLFLFPAPYILLGSWLETLSAASTPHRQLSRLLTLVVLSITLWWSYLWSVRIAYEKLGLLRAPTRAQLMDTVAESVAHHLQTNPEAEFILLIDFNGENFSAFDWVPDFIRNQRVRVLSVTEGFIIPAAPTCYLLGPGVAINTQATALVEIEATHHPELAASPNLPWPIYCAEAPTTNMTPIATWENGLELLTTRIEGDWQPGNTLFLTYSWQYTGNKPTNTYHLFNHLLHDGELIAQIDGRGVPTHYWQDGDQLFTYFTLTLPETLPVGVYQLYTGMYTWPGLESVLLSDGTTSHHISEWVRP